MLFSLQAAYGMLEPLSAYSCAFSTHQDPNPGVFPTLKLLPVSWQFLQILPPSPLPVAQISLFASLKDENYV